jgi:hypothetical protein
MRITFGVLVVSASLMLASVAYANMSSLDPEHFLDPHEQDTVALIASDLAALAQVERAKGLPREPELSASSDVAPAVEPLSEGTTAAANAEVIEQEVAAAPELAVENEPSEATGSLPLTAMTDAQPTALGDENAELALIDAPGAVQTSAPEGAAAAAALQ